MLNVSRAELRKAYEEIGFKFADLPIHQNGRVIPRLMGTAPMLVLELIGNPDNLHIITLQAGVTPEHKEIAATASLLMMGLLNRVAPEWASRGKWLTARLKQARRVPRGEAIYKDVKACFRFRPKQSTLQLQLIAKGGIDYDTTPTT